MRKTDLEAQATTRLRCAIYTRKSTEEGLEQDFNSLDAQREAAAAFIQSQRREGWIDSDPAALAVAPKREQKVPAHLSVDEMLQLLDSPDVSTPLGRRDRAILELFYASGIRLSELVALDLEDVDLPGRMVRGRRR